MSLKTRVSHSPPFACPISKHVVGIAVICLVALLAGVSPVPSAAPEKLPGTEALTWGGDLAERMMDGAHRFVERKIEESASTRRKYWSTDQSSRQAYEHSVEANRVVLSKILGVVDSRVPARLEVFGDDADPSMTSETEHYRVFQVRWRVLDGVHGEGLWVRPKSHPVGGAIAIPDADQSPEQIMGLSTGVPLEAQFARRLAENGFEVIVPVLIDRGTRWSGNPEIKMTDQTHREWIYRQAFHMGRHIIGYEVQKILAAVDWFTQKERRGGIGVAGYGEGGLLALYSAALDKRIDAVLVSGYFDSRQKLWSEPIYRNVWGLLRHFGDAELAALVAPRPMVVEHSASPVVRGQKGDLTTPEFESVRREFERVRTLAGSDFQRRRLIGGGTRGPLGPGSREALSEFAASLGVNSNMHLSGTPPADRGASHSPAERMRRNVRELEAHVQALVRRSEHVRDRFYLLKAAPELGDSSWTRELRHPTRSPGAFAEASSWFRDYFRDEVLGQFEDPLLPPRARTRRIYDEEKWTGYEVVLDVWDDVFAWGVLLLPKDLRPGERRPVVVCQHGRQGLPGETIEGNHAYYRNFAARLAERGFITFSPHNLYRGEDRYRWLDRKANGVKASLFSFILAQHDQILRWLTAQPFVDGRRIGFYGLSYGGETAVRIPAILQNYSLSICSGDFNNWTRKVASTDQPFSFMFTIEWEMPYFDMGNTFDYAEMVYLMVPRPFMVERGHHDRVGRDAWVAHEYAKVRWLYTQFGLEDRTEIEFFNGGHTINGEGTFRFLHRHLKWPEP